MSEIEKYIPLDKSWIIRMGILDLINGHDQINKFLAEQKDLGKDIQALERVIKTWYGKGQVDVGESGTIYRFVRFYFWKNNIDREIKTSDTLIERIARGAMTNNSDIVNWPPEELGTLDHETTQWQTMAYLLGDKRKIANPKYKLKVTYDSDIHWKESNEKGEPWKARKDPTLFNQAKAFLDYLKTGKIIFTPEQAEDYCFAIAFNVIDNKILETPEGKIMFESVKGHETDRIKEMEKSIYQAKRNQKVDSKDHRVVQAISMRYFNKGYNNRQNFVAPDCVNKTWPKFWDFIEYAGNLKK